mgnify:CR=1 FL=1
MGIHKDDVVAMKMMMVNDGFYYENTLLQILSFL